MGLGFYFQDGETTTSVLIGSYIFVLVSLIGVFGAYPGGTKTKNEYGDLVRTGSQFNLSRLQSAILLLWSLGMGAYIVYILEFKM